MVWGDPRFEHLGLQAWGDTSCNKTGYLCLWKLFGHDDDSDNLETSSDCKCPSDCEETIYFMEMTQSRNEKKRRLFNIIIIDYYNYNYYVIILIIKSIIIFVVLSIRK